MIKKETTKRIRLSIMYFYWIQSLEGGRAMDFLGYRFWLMREFGLSENTAKYTVRMFYAWLINGVMP